MGIKHFFLWFKKNFRSSYQSYNLSEQKHNQSLDVLLIDLNGLFHTSAQKIYKYGNFKENKSLLLTKNSNIKINKNLDVLVYQDTCDTILNIAKFVNPKTLVLCVDGVAPLAKQSQQRQRRFRSALENSDCPFDTCSISTGTEFLYNFSEYIENFIKTCRFLKEREVVFSSQAVAGEGEHKLLAYIRKNQDANITFCIYSPDADLFMLALATHHQKFFILREDNYENTHYLIDINKFRVDLLKSLYWNGFNEKDAINDFVFMCFLTGNDFLPHMYGVEIAEGSIEDMFEIYRQVGELFQKHLTKEKDSKIRFIRKSLSEFMKKLGNIAFDTLEEKQRHPETFIRDDLIEKYTFRQLNIVSLDTDGYRSAFYEKYFPKENFSEGKEYFSAKPKNESICHEYLKGMNWVLNYYRFGVPDWNWRYPYSYAPLAFDVGLHTKSFSFSNTFIENKPTSQFIQLISILPPKSANLLPPPLNTLLTDKNSKLQPFCPEKFIIDCAGKRKEWEGIVILPMLDYEIVNTEYKKLIKKVDKKYLKFNEIGQTYLYKYGEKEIYEL